MITEIDASLLEKIADLTGKPVGAFNIRKDMGCEARQSTEHIAIDPRADGKPGIDIHFKEGTKGETCHIPVIISQTGMSDMVYNDFYVADDCDVTIVAGCGIHNSGCDESRHDGIHTFHIGKNCRVRYTEKHYGEDAKGETGKNIMNPQTIVYLGENSTMQMDTIQIRGIVSTLRDTQFYCERRQRGGGDGAPADPRGPDRRERHDHPAQRRRGQGPCHLPLRGAGHLPSDVPPS